MQNRFECNIVGLEPAVKLGLGDFEDPTVEALRSAGREVYTKTGNAGFSHVSNRSFPNTALSFAGNIEVGQPVCRSALLDPLTMPFVCVQLTSDAAYVPPRAPARLHRVDYVEKGRRNIFAGQLTQQTDMQSEHGMPCQVKTSFG